MLAILDAVTADLAHNEKRRSDDFKALRKGLGYCWSVAVAALPSAGKHMLERWLTSNDADVRWVMNENLRKARLARLDPVWAAAMQSALRR